MYFVEKIKKKVKYFKIDFSSAISFINQISLS